jgi:transposase
MDPMARPSKYSPEVRERAVRMVFEHAGEYPSQWAAMRSIAEKFGCTTEGLRRWVRQAERDAGKRPGLTTSEREELKRLQRENFELKRANEILKKAAAFSPRRSSTAARSDGGLHRSAPGELRSRADLRGPAHRSVHLLPAEGAPAACDDAIGPRAAR